MNPTMLAGKKSSYKILEGVVHLHFIFLLAQQVDIAYPIYVNSIIFAEGKLQRTVEVNRFCMLLQRASVNCFEAFFRTRELSCLIPNTVQVDIDIERHFFRLAS